MGKTRQYARSCGSVVYEEDPYTRAATPQAFLVLVDEGQDQPQLLDPDRTRALGGSSEYE